MEQTREMHNGVEHQQAGEASTGHASGIITPLKKDSTARRLELQRARRRRHPRIDYYPSKEARAVLKAIMSTRRGVEGTWSAVIDSIVLGRSR